MKKNVFIVVFGLLALSLNAQTYLDVTPTAFVQGLGDGSSAACGDLNGDGKLDIILVGFHGNYVYVNDGKGSFTLADPSKTGLDAGGMWWSSVDIADYDGDGKMDIVMQGWDGDGTKEHAFVYKGNGDCTFTKVVTLAHGLANGNVQFGDYDNDGKMDIIQTGWDGVALNGFAYIYHNAGNNTFTPISTPQIPGIADGQAKWGDLNKDGKLDIVLEGWNATKIFLGDGAGGFTVKSNTLPAYDLSFVNIVDYDKDGNLDLLFGGHVPGSSPNAWETKVAKGDGAGNFTLKDFGLPGVERGPAVIGDCDKDGFNDIFIAGWNGKGSFYIYKNDGTNNAFSPISGINSVIAGYPSGSLLVKDFNGDGYDEIFKCGWGSTKLYNNIVPLLAFQVDIDGYRIQHFDRSQTIYNMNLPYTYNTVPVVSTTLPGYTINQATNLTGTLAERTATVTVPSASNGSPATYSIVFTKIPKLDLYLCIGQSNMVGYAPIDATLGDLNPIDNSYLLNNANLFETALAPLAKYSNVLASFDVPMLGVGPSYSFAKAISASTYNPIGLIVNSRGASSINSWLKEGNGSQADTLYAPTMKRALEAKKWGDYKAILWHQGENDMADTTGYKTKLARLVNELRSDLGDSQLLFVAGQVGQWRTDLNPFNSMITRISSFVPHSAYVSSTGLTNGSHDTWHFDRPSQITLGERYAAIIENAVYNSTAVQQPTTKLANQIFVSYKQLIVNTSVNRNELQIFDITGKMLKNETFASTNKMIDLSKYEAGSYIVKLKNNQGQETKIIQLQ